MSLRRLPLPWNQQDERATRMPTAPAADGDDADVAEAAKEKLARLGYRNPAPRAKARVSLRLATKRAEARQLADAEPNPADRLAVIRLAVNRAAVSCGTAM
jgi:hypothetical protein